VTTVVWHSRPRVCEYFSIALGCVTGFPSRVQRGIPTFCRIACVECDFAPNRLRRMRFRAGSPASNAISHRIACFEYDFDVETRHAASPEIFARDKYRDTALAGPHNIFSFCHSE
jgi:hypothetical protein